MELGKLIILVGFKAGGPARAVSIRSLFLCCIWWRRTKCKTKRPSPCIHRFVFLPGLDKIAILHSSPLICVFLLSTKIVWTLLVATAHIMSSDQDNDFSSKITVLIMIGVGVTALVVTLCHCIAMGWSSRRRPARRRRPQRFALEITGAQSSIENSAAQLIPAYKYQRGMTLAGDEGGTCAICLGEFEEGEELRTLPECVHTFHVPCIDMWLNSHSNCPMCRTDAISSPQVVLRSMDFGPDGGSDTFPTNVGTLQNVTVISRTT